MPREISIVIVSERSNLVDQMEASVVDFSQTICRVTSSPVSQAEDLAMEDPVDMIIFDIRSHEVEHDLDLCAKLMRAMPQTTWVLTSEKTDSDLILRSLRLGAKDFLVQPWKPEELRTVVHRALQTKLSQENTVQGRGKLITLFSNKGGVGTTTIACNLAASLAEMHPDRVLLCDLVLQHGDVVVFLDVKQKYTISNMVQEIDRLDRELLFNQLQKHPSGLYVLPSPFLADETAQIRSSAVSDAIDFLLSCFDFVVVDGGHEFTSQVVPILNKSDLIFLVTVPDIPTIRNTKRCLNMFEQFGFPSERTKVIVNRFDAKQHIDLSSVEKNVDFPISIKLPNDYAAAINAINQGQPINKVSRKSKLSKQITELAFSVNGKNAALKQDSTMMSQLFGLGRKKEEPKKDDPNKEKQGGK